MAGTIVRLVAALEFTLRFVVAVSVRRGAIRAPTDFAVRLVPAITPCLPLGSTATRAYNLRLGARRLRRLRVIDRRRVIVPVTACAAFKVIFRSARKCLAPVSVLGFTASFRGLPLVKSRLALAGAVPDVAGGFGSFRGEHRGERKA